MAAFEPPAPGPAAPRGPIEEPLLLSFYAVDDYLTCPLKFKYGHVLRVPLAPHHALIYGSALHKAVQEFHRRHARGDVMTEEELTAAFELAWTNEGFLTRDHEEARLAAGRDALRRFRDEQLKPGAVIPAYVERDFSFTLDGDRVRGRWDRVDIEPADDAQVAPDRRATAPHADTVSPTLGLTGRERVTITDYKSSDVRDPVKARQRARDSLQLQIYAMGYEALTGRLPDYLQLHFLDSGLVGRVEVDPKRLAEGAPEDRGRRGRDAGPRLHGEAGPDVLLLLPVPRDLPVQRRDVTPDGPRVHPRDHVRLRQHARSGRPGRAARGSSRRPVRHVVDRLGPFELDAFLAIWAEERARQFREEVPQFREVDLADRFVRVLARLRGMPPPDEDDTLGPGGCGPEITG